MPPSPTAVDRRVAAAPRNIAWTMLLPASPADVQICQRSQGISDSNVAEVLNILEALPSKSADVEKFLEQAGRGMPLCTQG